MYNRIKINNKYSITFNTFRKLAKNVSNVYKIGIRNWISYESYNYSIVLYTFRIIFSIKKLNQNTTNG